MQRYNIDLSNKTVALTGAAGAICSCFAKELAKVGAKVALIDINLDGARKVADEINENGGIARAYFANVLDRASLDDCYEKVVKDLGCVNMLINGAGGNHPAATTDKEYYEKGDITDPSVKSFFSLESNAIRKLFDLNFTSILLTTQAFAKGMVVSNFTEWLAVHFAGMGIRVNAIAPGFFVGNQNRALLYNEKGELTPRSHKIISHTPMGRFGELGELVGTLLWLADEEFSGFVTGVVVPVDGGFSAYSGV